MWEVWLSRCIPCPMTYEISSAMATVTLGGDTEAAYTQGQFKPNCMMCSVGESAQTVAYLGIFQYIAL
jgi:hypothetical protein